MSFAGYGVFSINFVLKIDFNIFNLPTWSQASELNRRMSGVFPNNWQACLPKYNVDDKPKATRYSTAHGWKSKLLMVFYRLCNIVFMIIFNNIFAQTSIARGFERSWWCVPRADGRFCRPGPIQFDRNQGYGGGRCRTMGASDLTGWYVLCLGFMFL